MRHSSPERQGQNRFAAALGFLLIIVILLLPGDATGYASIASVLDQTVGHVTSTFSTLSGPPQGMVVNAEGGFTAQATTVTADTCSPNPADKLGKVVCNATITTSGTLDTAIANVTFPDNSIQQPALENAGSTYNFTFSNTTQTGFYNVTWFANDTGGASGIDDHNFTVQDKGIVPACPGSPFCTGDPNPRSLANLSCLNSTLPGQVCSVTWNVTGTGAANTTREFFALVNSTNSSSQASQQNESPRLNISIIAQTPGATTIANPKVRSEGFPLNYNGSPVINHTVLITWFGFLTDNGVYEGGNANISAALPPNFNFSSQFDCGFTQPGSAACTCNSTTQTVNCSGVPVNTTIGFVINATSGDTDEPFLTSILTSNATNDTTTFISNNVTFLKIAHDQIFHTLVEFGRGRGNYFFDSQGGATSAGTGIGNPYVPNGTAMELNYLHKINSVKQYFNLPAVTVENATFHCTYPNSTIVRQHLPTSIERSGMIWNISYGVPEIEGSWERMGYMGQFFDDTDVNTDITGKNLTIECSNIEYRFQDFTTNKTAGNISIPSESFTLLVRSPNPFNFSANNLSRTTALGDGVTEVPIMYNFTNNETYDVTDVTFEILAPELGRFIGTRGELWGEGRDVFIFERSVVGAGATEEVTLVVRYNTTGALTGSSSVNLSRGARAQFVPPWEYNAYNPVKTLQSLSEPEILGVDMAAIADTTFILDIINDINNTVKHVNTTAINVSDIAGAIKFRVLNISDLLGFINTTLLDANNSMANNSIMLGQINFTAINNSIIIGEINASVHNNSDILGAMNQTLFFLNDSLAEINHTLKELNQSVIIMNHSLTDINATVTIINTTLLELNATLNASFAELNNTLKEINKTVLGINASLMDINNTVAVINNTVTVINATVNDINATVTFINATAIAINNTVTSLNVTITDINGTVTIINSTIFHINNTINIANISGIPQIISNTEDILRRVLQFQEFDEELVFLVTDAFGLQQQAFKNEQSGMQHEALLNLAEADQMLRSAADRLENLNARADISLPAITPSAVSSAIPGTASTIAGDVSPLLLLTLLVVCLCILAYYYFHKRSHPRWPRGRALNSTQESAQRLHDLITQLKKEE